MKHSIQLPFFPGFYETEYGCSDISYWAIKEEMDYIKKSRNMPELTEENLDFDYGRYEKDVIDAFIDVWKSYAPGYVKSVEFDKLDSPRYYNSRNDRLYAIVTFSENWKDEMKAFMKANADWLEKKINEDGLSLGSDLSSRFSDWDRHLFEEEDARYISTMIGYIMFRANNDIYNALVIGTMENIYAGSYVFMVDDDGKR